MNDVHLLKKEMGPQNKKAKKIMNNVQKKSDTTKKTKVFGEKRTRTKEKILNTTITLIQEKGANGFTARDVAKHSDVAVGTVYTVFESFDDLVFSANSHTLDNLRNHIFAHLEAVTPSTPQDTLLAIGEAYCDFAMINKEAWLGMFSYQPQKPTPDWVLQSHLDMLNILVEPTKAIRPDKTDEEHLNLAKTLFLSVQGILQYSLEERFVGLPTHLLQANIKMMISSVLASITITNKA